MALEVPVVASRIAGVPRLIGDGANGLLVGAGSVDQLAAGLGRMLADAELRLRLGRAARETVETSFSFALRMDKIRAVYDALLETDSHEPPAFRGRNPRTCRWR